MAHLNDKLAEFFFNELPPSEMAVARQHVAECADCSGKVEQFNGIHLRLKTATDWDPPRNIVFSAPQRRAAWFDWRSIAASMAAAALVAGIFVRLAPAPPATTVMVPAPATPAAVQIVQPEKIDYGRIVKDLRQSDRVWVAAELQTRDRQIQQLRAEVAYYDTFQRAVMKETLENGSAIQLLAQRASLR